MLRSGVECCDQGSNAAIRGVKFSGVGVSETMKADVYKHYQVLPRDCPVYALICFTVQKGKGTPPSVEPAKVIE